MLNTDSHIGNVTLLNEVGIGVTCLLFTASQFSIPIEILDNSIPFNLTLYCTKWVPMYPFSILSIHLNLYTTPSQRAFGLFLERISHHLTRREVRKLQIGQIIRQFKFSDCLILRSCK